jgi:hypothetical protein
LIATAAAIGAPAGTTEWQMLGVDYVKSVQMMQDALGAPIYGLMIGQNGKRWAHDRRGRPSGDGRTFAARAPRDPGIGILRHADAGYDSGIEHAKRTGLSATLPKGL